MLVMELQHLEISHFLYFSTTQIVVAHWWPASGKVVAKLVARQWWATSVLSSSAPGAPPAAKWWQPPVHVCQHLVATLPPLGGKQTACRPLATFNLILINYMKIILFWQKYYFYSTDHGSLYTYDTHTTRTRRKRSNNSFVDSRRVFELCALCV